MTPEKLLEDVWGAVSAAVAALAPAALGSGVAVAMKQGLSWTERMLQFAVGIVASWYGSQAAIAIWAPDPFIAQAVGFTLGLLAYDALPRFRERALTLFTDALDALRDRFIKRRDQ